MPLTKGLMRVKRAAAAWRSNLSGNRPESPVAAFFAPPIFEVVPEGWSRQRTDPAILGWNVESIAKANAEKWDSFNRYLSGTGPLGIAHEAAALQNDNLCAHNMVMAFAYTLALASCGRRQVRLLDWGGGVGHYGKFAAALLPEVDIAFCCKDLPALVDCGRRLYPEATFYTEDSEFAGQSFDLVMASGALQYVEDWRGTMSRLAAAAQNYVYIARLPLVQSEPSYVMVQRPYAYGYHTEYLSWTFNRHEFLNHARSTGLELKREFLGGERLEVQGCAEPCVFSGFLFQRAPNS